MPFFPATNTLQPEHKGLNSRLLELPGELRNHIFSYCIFHLLGQRPLMVAHSVKKGHFNPAILKAGLFHVCHQLRAEALSYLAATKGFKILGIEPASSFFNCLGAAAADLKRITVAQPIVRDAPMSSRQIDTFFAFLDQATSLQFFRLELGRIGAPFTWEKENIGTDWVFLERTLDFVKSRPDLNFQWRAGAYDLRATSEGTPFARSAGARELLGAGTEHESQYGVMYMW